MKSVISCLIVMSAIVLVSASATDYLQFNSSAAAFVDFTISGNVKADGANLQGASVSLTGTQSQTTVTDASGNYSFTVAAGGNYTVSVYKSGYSFNPTTQAFNNLQSNQIANFQNGVPLPTPRPLGLVAWYKGEGNAADSSGNGYSGTLFGATFAAGKVGQAFSMDGVDDRVEVASNVVIDPTNAGALAAWVKFNQLPSSASHNMVIITKSSLMSFFELNAEADNKFRFYVGSGSSVSSSTVIQTGVWYYVAGVWDSAGLRIYVNGVLENTNATQNIVRTQSTVPLKIGDSTTIAGQVFNGLIDEAQVYNRALSSIDVQIIYSAGSAGIFVGSIFTPSASSGKIAFTSVGSGNHEIYTVNTNGTNPTNITNNPARDIAPSWSPDGSKIAFSSDRDGTPGFSSGIYVMNADGSNQTRLTTGADQHPTWSPDGSKIAFSRGAEGFPQSWDVFVMNADGTNLIDLTPRFGFDGEPTWSPDGSKIAYAYAESTQIVEDEIYVMDSNGANQTNIMNTPGLTDAMPAWSPDGTKIIFMTSRLGGNWEIFGMNPGGGNQTNISNNAGFDGYPAWSPDGTKIVFYTGAALHTMNPDGSNRTLLISMAGLAQYRPAWQPIRSNIPVSPANNVRLVFASISQPGFIVATSLTQTQIPALPQHYALASPTQAYDIRTSANYTGNATVGFDVPNVTDAVICARLRLLHFENGVWTGANNATPVYNSSTQVCTVSQTSTSLGLFAVANFTARTQFDFDGDARTDISIFRPSNGQWWYEQSLDNNVRAFTFGSSTDKIVPADYDGDMRTDIAFWRPATGEWFVLRSSNLTFFAVPFGISTDKPAPGDFDADGRADLAVYRASQGTWFINKSTGGVDIIQFGASGDIPVVADYDNDARADIAIYRPTGGSGGEWWILRSSNGGVFATPFGSSSDKPVPADYTGDGRADCAFFRASTGEWFVLRSENLTYFAAPFGAAGDIPSPGDYDGDGKTDFAVFRPSTSTWFVNRSTQGILIQGFGSTGDIPVPSAFVP